MAKNPTETDSKLDMVTLTPGQLSFVLAAYLVPDRRPLLMAIKGPHPGPTPAQLLARGLDVHELSDDDLDRLGINI